MSFTALSKLLGFAKNSLPLNVSRSFSMTPVLGHIRKLTRLRVVDNSNIGKQAMLEGKPPRCIHIYKKAKRYAIGTVGDKVLVAIKGLKKKAFIVGVKKEQKHMIPKFDSNNIVLIDDHGNPLGTRVLVPIPSFLRGRGEFSKIIAISSRFV
ncbi:39S ribosomal protein L14, mitochondrial-like [Stegodyphus dumicola]|uniref:39S ribosomal protein L14, mitochondrial-like n=1 Tax=Stegodyphus dumicola TaxID=202533 RepID=UPI0015B34756|nr:39S ribosomal protein L14, mitochondrial-like [Stegodyphus dumicola]